MSARKARKLADGSRQEGTVENESDFSMDNEFSTAESRKHHTRSTVGRSLELSQLSDHQVNGTQSDDEESSARTPRKRKRIPNGLSNGQTNGETSSHAKSQTRGQTRSQAKSQTNSQTNGQAKSQTNGRTSGRRRADASDDEEASGDSAVSGESNSESDAESEAFSQTQPATQNGTYSQMDGYESSQLDESQYMETQDDPNADPLPPDCGTIESIELFNFMCHDHFEITFNPRVNFVIGKNGSGKSAILTAIVIVLGGRATNTGRGQSLTGFIKSGKQSAKIVIRLCNRSPFKKKTFKPDEYGPSILVERIIKLDGTSNYILKSAYGKVISRKKEELLSIIHLFSIQIENPVCILSQEVSRNFLNSKNARDKYEFFMKATNLEHLRSEYALALQQSKQAKEILTKKKSFMPAIEKELKELEKKVDVFTKFNRKRDQLADLIAELAWAAVRVLEREEIEPPKVIAQLNKKIDDIATRMEACKAECGELEKTREEFNTDMQNEYTEELQRLNAKKENLNKRQEELRRSRCDKSLKINEQNFSISSLNKDKDQLQRKIDDIKRQIAQQEKLIAEQERIKAQKIEMQEEQETIKQENEQLRAEKAAKQEEHTKASDALKSLNYRLNKMRSNLSDKDNLLKNLKGSTKDSLAKFGQPFVRLVKRIDEEHERGRFKCKPIGPLGFYIKLKDDHVSTALEACLKKLMFSFVCDNFEDATHLTKLIREINFQHCPQPYVLRRKFGARFNIRSTVSLQQYKSLLDYVSIENDVVFNILLDKSNLDQTLYIPEDNKAVNLLIDESRIPSNLKTAYSAVGTQFYPKRPGSNFRQYANTKRPSGLLTSDTSLAIERVQGEVTDLRDSVQRLIAEKTELEASVKAMNVELREFDRRIEANFNRLNEISKQIYELGSVKEFKPEDLSIFEGDYQQCVERIEKAKEELASHKDDMKDIDSKVKIVKSDLAQVDEDIQGHKERFERLRKKVAENEFKIKKNQENIAKLESRIQEFNERKEEKMQELTAIALKKERAIEHAKEKCDEPVETDRTPAEVQKEVDDLNEFIRQNENRLGNKEELFAAYKEKKVHYDKMNDQVQFLEKYINEFSDSIRKRARVYCKLRDHTTHQASKNFSKNLQILNFTGSLKIYHRDAEVDGKLKKAQTLEISINPKSSDPNKLYKDTRSLSGGERSFSTIAFLIALWESSYSPFNILDEVDVFMDKVTRNVALEALIDSANRKQGKQYIFLSPLRPEKTSINNLLKIFYMPEPKRVDQSSP